MDKFLSYYRNVDKDCLSYTRTLKLNNFISYYLFFRYGFYPNVKKVYYHNWSITL